MVSLRFSVVLIAVAVVLCAQLMAASAKPDKQRNKKASRGSSSNYKGSGDSKITPRKIYSTPKPRHGSMEHYHRGDSGRGHSRGLGSAFSHYDTSPRTPGGTKRGGSNGHHGGSGSSSSSGPAKRRGSGRGRGGQNNNGSHGLQKGGASVSNWPRQVREKNQRTINVAEKKIQQSENGLLRFLSKQISTRRGTEIDLGSILAKVKNSTSECAQKSKGAIMDFAKNTVSKSILGGCQESVKYAKLKEDLDTARKAFRKIENNQNKQFKSCKTEEGAASILAGTINPSWRTVTETPGLDVTQEEKEGDSFDGEDQNLKVLERTCRDRVENNTVFMEEHLERDITRLREEIDNIDQRELDNCWSQDFGKNLGGAGISTVMDTTACLIKETFIG